MLRQILEGRIHPWTVINRDLRTASFCFPKYRSDLKLQTWNQSGCLRQKTNAREYYSLPMQTCEHDSLDCQDILFNVSVNGFTKTRELSSREKPVSIALLQHLSSHVEGPLSQQPVRTKDCDEIVWDSLRMFFGVRQNVVLARSGQQQIQWLIWWKHTSIPHQCQPFSVLESIGSCRPYLEFWSHLYTLKCVSSGRNEVTLLRTYSSKEKIGATPTPRLRISIYCFNGGTVSSK